MIAEARRLAEGNDRSDYGMRHDALECAVDYLRDEAASADLVIKAAKEFYRFLSGGADV